MIKQKEKKELKKNLSSGCQLPPLGGKPLKREEKESRKITLRNWHVDQRQRWQPNNKTFNLSEFIMSYCCNAKIH